MGNRQCAMRKEQRLFRLEALIHHCPSSTEYFWNFNFFPPTFATDLVPHPDKYRDGIKREVSQNLTLSP